MIQERFVKHESYCQRILQTHGFHRKFAREQRTILNQLIDKEKAERRTVGPCEKPSLIVDALKRN